MLVNGLKVKMPKKEIAPHSPSLTYDNIKRYDIDYT